MQLVLELRVVRKFQWFQWLNLMMHYLNLMQQAHPVEMGFGGLGQHQLRQSQLQEQ